MVGEMIPGDKLPQELWMLIFTNLAAKILSKLRCVSKTWRSMIDNPNFILMHLNLFKNNSDEHFLLSWEKQGFWPLVEAHLTIGIRTVGKFRKREQIMGFAYSSKEFHFEHNGYVNGLMLFSQYYMPQHSVTLFLFNPSIMKFKALPEFPSGPPGRAEVVIGFDPVGNDHKVVVIYIRFLMPRDLFPDVVQCPDCVAVYELTTGCWRVNYRIELPYKWGMQGYKTYVKGFMHWLSHDNSRMLEGYLPKNDTHVVSFDFAREVFSYTELPGDRSDDCEKIAIPFRLGESLAVFDVCCVERRVCIWVMKKCGGSGIDSWNKWYDRVLDSATFGYFQENKYKIKNFVYMDKSRKCLLEVNGKVKSYDLETHTMKDLKASDGCYVIDPYVDSLLLCKDADAHSLNIHPEGQ